MQNSILIQLSPDELKQMIVEAITEYHGAKENLSEPELISRDEVCKLLNFNKTTLHKHTKSGRLKSYGIGGRVLYKRGEVLAAITPLKK